MIQIKHSKTNDLFEYGANIFSYRKSVFPNITIRRSENLQILRYATNKKWKRKIHGGGRQQDNFHHSNRTSLSDRFHVCGIIRLNNDNNDNV